MNTDSLKYPIGKFIPPGTISEEDIICWTAVLEKLPLLLRQAVQDLSEEQLNSPYREGGWTLRQVVHHLADSHMNAYIRFKLALTEDHPNIKPYIEKKWAEMPDSTQGQIEMSLQLLESLHRRWTSVLSNLNGAEWKRSYYHPENKKTFQLDYALGLYAWHSEHHLAHITGHKQRQGW